MFLDSKLDFDEHIKGVFDKTSKSVGLIRELRNFLPRPSLLQIYKSFVRPHYLSDIIPSTTRRYSSGDANNIPLVRVNNNYFMNTSSRLQ